VAVGSTSADAEILTGVVPPGTGNFNQVKKGINQYQASY
jgi:hypothetical protein